VRPVKACGVKEVESHSHLLLHFIEVNDQLDSSGRFNLEGIASIYPLNNFHPK